jgi:hypothetical protein
MKFTNAIIAGLMIGFIVGLTGITYDDPLWAAIGAEPLKNVPSGENTALWGDLSEEQKQKFIKKLPGSEFKNLHYLPLDIYLCRPNFINEGTEEEDIKIRKELGLNQRKPSEFYK